MGITEKELIDIFANEKELTCIDLDSLEELEKSMKDYQTLIENGIATPRGYNLLAIDSEIPILEFNRF